MAALTADVVGLIRKTILDSYKYSDGFPILKELVQNANDADASEMKIYFRNGIPEAQHELLRNPALIVYNNGGFTQKNERGIQRIADNNKEADKSKIGKFGLGMKSIFHLCDMFFYAVNTSKAKNESDRVPYHLETINPWETDIDKRHANWVDFSEEDKLLFEKALPIDMKNEQGFLLWIPGKTKDNSPDHITQDFVDLTNPFNKGDIYSIVDKLKVTLALLSKVSPAESSLKTINIIKDKNISINLVESKDYSYITEVSDRKVKDLVFESYKPITKINVIESLTSKDVWANNREEEIDCNLIFIKQPVEKGRTGKLHIQYCVYLPLENPEIEIDLDLDSDYYILFHGNFSVDSGRTGIQGYFGLLDDADIEKVDDTETAIRYWNKILAQKVLFPNIPAFFECAANSDVLKLKEFEINQILKAMLDYSEYGKVPLIRDNKYSVSEKGFALCYKPFNDLISKKWSLFDIEKNEKSNYIYIPNVENFLVLNKVFPSIKEDKSNFICKDFSLYSILPNKYNPDENDVKTLLKEFSFSSKEEIKFLTMFIILNKRIIQEDNSLQAVLIDSLKRCLLAMEFNQLYLLRESLKYLFDKVNDSTGDESQYKVYSVNINKDRNTTGFEDSDWIKWWSIDSKFILVPGFFEIIYSCSEKNLIDGSDSVCDFIENYIKDSSKQYYILSGIYPQLKQSINRIIAKYPTLHLFEIRNMQLGKNEYADAELISCLKQDKELFYAIRPNDYEHVLYLYSQLIKSFSSFSVYTISDAVIKRTGLDVSGILPAEPESIIESYAAHDKFREYDYDLTQLPKFLEALCAKKPKFSESEQHHIRFLISSLDKELKYDETLYIYDTLCDPVWRKIFDSCKGDVKVISPNFDSYTKDTICLNEDVLNIDILNDTTCVNALKNAVRLNQVDFMLDKYFERNDVLSKILQKLNYVTDKEVFYGLPIHIDYKTGERKKCTEGMYLNSIGIDFPEDFENPHVLFRLYDDVELSKTQESFFGESRTLTYLTSINILLRNNKLQKNYSEWIFEQIKSSGNRDLSRLVETDEIGVSKWIPLRKNKWNKEYCCLREILKEGLFSTGTSDIVTSKLPIFSTNDLDISLANIELLHGRKLLVTDIQTELSIFVDAINTIENIDNIPVSDFNSLKAISEILKNNNEFPQFSIVWALIQDNNIHDKESIFNNFYSKIRVGDSDSYNLFINLINKTIVGHKNTIELFNKILEIITTNHKNQFKILDIEQYPIQGPSIWKSPDLIAASVIKSIDKDFKLNSNTYDLVKGFVPRFPIKMGEGDQIILNSGTSPEEILNIFSSWFKQLKQGKLLYVFLYLLKDSFKKAALKTKNDSYFECITDDYEYQQCNDTNEWSFGYSQTDAILNDSKNHFHTVITIPKGNSAVLHSLAGNSVKVLLNEIDDEDYLYLESPQYDSESQTYTIALAKIKDKTLELDEKLKLLISGVLRRAYFQQNMSEITRVLNTIAQSNTYSVKATAIQIMDEIFGLFKQLGLNTNDNVKIFTQKERELSRSKATGKITSAQYAEAKEILIEELQELIEQKKDFQNTLHQAVMNKISDNQYDDDSVVYELLQNADDAVKDIIKAEPKTDFEVRVSENKSKITIIHYGREINQPPVGEEPAKYLDDLYNMLTINGSNKRKEDRDTGKFGLGFKSMHLICNAPIIRSGDLQFEIIGGMYPRIIPDAKLNPGETRIELKLKNSQTSEDVLSDFKRNAAVQTLFCKCINKIIIDGYEYFADAIELGSYKTGEVLLVSAENRNYLLFSNLNSKPSFSILFRLSDDKENVIEMKKTECKKIWNTTPLSDGENLPFAINSEFIPDTGRKHLADKKNDIVLSNIANGFANLLVDFISGEKNQYTASLLSLLVASSNIRDKTFTNFPKEILQDICDKSGFVANGYGGIINKSRKFVYIKPTSYGLDADRSSDFMELVQSYLDYVTNNKYYLMTGVAKECYTDKQLEGIDQITNISEFLFKYVSDKKLTNEILEKFLRIKEKTSSGLSLNWNIMYLHADSGEWVKADSIIIDDEPLIPSNQKLGKEYTSEVRHFLETELPNEAYKNFYKNGNNQGNSDDDPSTEVSYEVIWKSVESVYEWWVEKKKSGEWNQIVENYYCSHKYPSIMMLSNLKNKLRLSAEELLNLKQDAIPEEWCTLLWVAAAQSMPYNWGNRDASNRNGIEELRSMEVLDSFCIGDNLQTVYELYLKKNPFNENRIRLFELLLRLHKYRMDFGKFYDLMHNLPARSSDNLSDFLIPAKDEDLSGYGIDIAPSNITFKIGYRMIIQNLGLCGFWNDSTVEQLKHLFKMVIGMNKEFDLDSEPEELVKEFYQCFDLPFQITAEYKRIGE